MSFYYIRDNSGELKFLLIIATKFSNSPVWRGISAAVRTIGIKVGLTSFGAATDLDISNMNL